MWLEGITKADIMSLTARRVEQCCIVHARFEQCLERCWHHYIFERKNILLIMEYYFMGRTKAPVSWFYQTPPILASASKELFPVAGNHSRFLKIPIPLACRYRR